MPSNDTVFNSTSLGRSPVLWAVVLLVAVNCMFWIWHPLSKVDPESLPSAHTWVWWATHEWLQEKKAPEVVLMGSSLVMHPVSRLDADFLKRNLDYVHHHRSCYMAHLLSERLGLPGMTCFNFALPGGMISDDYIVCRALMTGDRKPRIMVLGLSLRDFIDSGVNCPAATPAFRYLKRFVAIDDLVDKAMPQPWQRFDYAVGKSVYLWGKKLDVQVTLSELAKSRFQPLIARMCSASRLNDMDLSRNMPSNLRSEVEEGMFIVRADQPYSYEDNSREYRKRYRTGNERLFINQSWFLDRLLGLCQVQNIQPVLVNMPLTATNRSLMPRGAYRRYLNLLSAESSKYHCAFVDLGRSTAFERTDFYDTSHMTATGGKKLVDSIVRAIAAHRQLNAVLAHSSQPGGRLASQANPL